MTWGQKHFLSSFASVVKRNRNKPAILTEGTGAVTYQQLQEKSIVLAAQLVKLGAGRDQVIGLCLDKSAEYIASLLAVWYSGAAFLPLDPQLPKQRLLLMLEEANVKLALVQPGYEQLFAGTDITMLSSRDESATSPLAKVIQNAGGESDLAYVIYTSGSTGAPKAVLVEHRGIVNFLEAQIEVFQLTPESRSLFYLSTNFDASISDIGAALLSGATLCLEPASSLQPGPAFGQLLKDRKITHMDIPPALLRVLDPSDMPAHLKTVIIGGEACAPHIVRNWAQRLRVVNVYGPTEATVCTSLCLCDPEKWERPLIGQPIPNINYHLLDEQLKPCAPGTPAELFISGIGLARGYLNRPELTACKFINWNGERLYRTGDLVVEHPGGQLEFLGRIDRQVKIRGMLVEPEEIESRLKEYESVQQAAVLKRQLNEKSSREVLVAFIVGGPGHNLNRAILQEHLTKSLPRWMLPTHFEFLDSLPLTVTGKPDLSALQSCKLASGQVASAATDLDGTAGVLSQIWCRILGVSEIGLDDDFFELGGDSFSAIEAVVAAEAQGIPISPTLLITRSSIRKILSALDEAKEHNQPTLSLSGAMSCDYLCQDVCLDAHWLALLERARSRTNAGIGCPQNILLTGSTGFLGSKLLAELLKRTAATIYCLVRAQSTAAARSRLMEALKQQGQRLSDLDTRRIVPVIGNLEQERFGLSIKEWSALANEIDTIYHCAAQVNMLLPYCDLRAANVGGTMAVARFMLEGREKRLHYASTLSVLVATDCNSGNLLESDDLQLTKYVYGGYAQTKWAAEVFLRSLNGAAGPINYFRFGLITGDSQSGHSSPTDFLLLFSRGIQLLGCVPSIQSPIAVDVTPVDYAAAAMGYLSLNGVGCDKPTTYHIANPQSLSLQQLLQIMRDSGIGIEELPLDEFLNRLRQNEQLGAAESAACLALCRGLSSPRDFERLRTMDLFQSTDVTFDMKNTLSGLSGSGICCPTPNADLISTYLKQVHQKWEKSKSRPGPQGCPFSHN